MTTTNWPDTFTDFPCAYSTVILEALDRLLPASGTFLDPCAGSGRCFDLERPGRTIVGTEIEPEFAALHPRTIVADATALPFATASFTGGYCSPSYPNRMNGDYTAPGWTKDPTGRRNYSLSKRWLARDADATLHAHNTARYGERRHPGTYWLIHALIWAEVARVVRPGGIFIVNCKDLPRMEVTEPHVALLVDTGFTITHRERVHPPGYRNGAHASLRVDHEDIVVLTRGG